LYELLTGLLPRLDWLDKVHVLHSGLLFSKFWYVRILYFHMRSGQIFSCRSIFMHKLFSGILFEFIRSIKLHCMSELKNYKLYCMHSINLCSRHLHGGWCIELYKLLTGHLFSRRSVELHKLFGGILFFDYWCDSSM
jgi:hypothetical protein